MCAVSERIHLLFEHAKHGVAVVVSMVEFHLGLDELPCPSATKEDLNLLVARYARLVGAKTHAISTIIFHPKQQASRSFTVRAKVTVDNEDLFFAHEESYDLEEAVGRALLGLARQLRQRLHFLQWQEHQDAVRAE